MKKFLTVVGIIIAIAIVGNIIKSSKESTIVNAWEECSLSKSDKVFIAESLKKSAYNIDYNKSTYKLIDKTKYVVVVKVKNDDGIKTYTVTNEGKVAPNDTY